MVRRALHKVSFAFIGGPASLVEAASDPPNHPPWRHSHSRGHLSGEDHGRREGRLSASSTGAAGRWDGRHLSYPKLGIWRREGDRWVDLVPWTPSAAVRPGDAPNELTVRAIGPRLTFVVNGTEVAAVDATAAEGSVGLFAGGDGNEVAVERFAVQVPE